MLPTYSKADFFDYIAENDVKFVKLTFCDFLGRQRNISVLSSQLEDAFEHGVAIDSAAITGVGGIDLKLKPLSALLSVLPWRPHAGKVVSVFCNIANSDGTPYVSDPMVMLDRQVALLAKLGLKAQVGTECEFYVFKDDVGDVLEPFDRADYCACAPFDRCENLRRDVIANIEDMGLKPISSHHERGPGQNEVDFESADPAAAARNFMMFKTAVKNVCAVNGTCASFMPRPLENHPGSGLHLSITLSGERSEAASKAFAEGVLRRYREISCFANPTVNSYTRLKYNYKISYSANRGAAMRIFDNNVILLRTPDSSCNIFTVLALVIAAGREGIENGYALRAAGAYDNCLFNSVEEACDFAEKSEWLRANIGGVFDDVLSSVRKRVAAEKEAQKNYAHYVLHSDI